MKNNGNTVVTTPILYELNDSSSYSALKKGTVATQPLLRFKASNAHRSTIQDSFGASSLAPLLHRPNNQRLDFQTSANKQRTGARRSAEFVACN